MPGLRIGVQLASLRQPFKRALHTAARLGAQGIELDLRSEIRPQEMTQTAVRQLRKLLDDLNLRVCAVSFPTRRGYDVTQDLDRRLAATKEAMTFGYKLGASVLVNRIGRVPADHEGLPWQMLVAVLAELGQHGDRVGTSFAARTGAEEGPILAGLIDALPEGTIGVDLAPGDLAMNGHSVAEAVAALGPAVRHVHANDGVRDLGQTRGVEVELGRGLADFPALLGALEESNYQGWFTVERHSAEDPILEVSNAVEYLRQF